MDKQLQKKLDYLITKVDKLEQMVQVLGKANKHVNEEVVIKKEEQQAQNTSLKRNTENIRSLAYMVGEDNRTRQFLDSILNFTGGTVTQKQYKVLRDIADQYEFNKPLIVR